MLVGLRGGVVVVLVGLGDGVVVMGEVTVMGVTGTEIGEIGVGIGEMGS